MKIIILKQKTLHFIMESPNGGYNLTVRSVRPNLSEYPNKRFPVVLKLQGSWGLMNWFLNEPKIQPTASDGMIFVSFNSQLREDYFYPFGDSDRDYSGFKDQVDVAAVLENITQNSNVNPNAIGIWSSSAGAIMAAGI